MQVIFLTGLLGKFSSVAQKKARKTWSLYLPFFECVVKLLLLSLLSLLLLLLLLSSLFALNFSKPDQLYPKRTNDI